MKDIFNIIFLPVIGTALGSSAVFFLRGEMNVKMQKMMKGFASGIMVAASVWSLLLPSIERSEHLGRFSFFPAALGFMTGIFALLLADKLIPHLNIGSGIREGIKSKLKRSSMLVLAVVIHNFPEGMAVGAALFAATKNIGVSLSAAFALSLGIAVQNFPEGAIISMPLASEGMNKKKAFMRGVYSGLVEPIGAIFTLLASNFMVAALPYLLAFAAGAMLYVVVEELIPDIRDMDSSSDIGTVMFSMGFVLMMTLDVMLG